ncbi:hypothetical protein [Mycolicibacterium houstonense]|uniref:hypothetical protein n=1 Tax=Mycolicibacterium houstonense TaxID=146021 RepID=UPI0008298799
MADDVSSEFPLHLDRYHLPEPEWTFPNATINLYAQDSSRDFPPVRQTAAGSPNILLALLDDVGFGWPSVNGGLVRMPTAERLHNMACSTTSFTPPHCARPHARRAVDRAQPPLGGHRRHSGDGHRRPRLLRHHPQELRNHG